MHVSKESLFVHVAPEIADRLERDWSEPVQIRFERLEGNELRMILRTYELTATQTLNSPEEATAQNVVDALRFVLMAQKDPNERDRLSELLLDLAPETDDNGGFELITLLAAEGDLKFSVKEDF